MAPTNRPKPATDGAAAVDAYLDRWPAAKPALTALRAAIRAAAPKATEVISYQIPTFTYHGPLVAFAAFKDHCGFYIMSPDVLRRHAAELEGYTLNKASIRFAPDAPLPAALVKRLVKARMVENEARRKK